MLPPSTPHACLCRLKDPLHLQQEPAARSGAGALHPFLSIWTGLHHLPLLYFPIEVTKLLMTLPSAPEERLTAFGAFRFSFPIRKSAWFQ